jgi:hypothetical protein
MTEMGRLRPDSFQWSRSLILNGEVGVVRGLSAFSLEPEEADLLPTLWQPPWVLGITSGPLPWNVSLFCVFSGRPCRRRSALFFMSRGMLRGYR